MIRITMPEKTKNRIFKKMTVVFLIAALSLAVAGCDYSARLKYTNFLADMDLTTRYDICFDSIKKNDAGLYIKEELRYLKADIASFSAPDDYIQEANYNFIRCADALLESIDEYESANYPAAEEAYSRADYHYLEARALVNKITVGNENV